MSVSVVNFYFKLENNDCVVISRVRAIRQRINLLDRYKKYATEVLYESADGSADHFVKENGKFVSTGRGLETLTMFKLMAKEINDE